MTPAGIRLVRSPDGARADVRIDRPPANVLDVAALGELTRAVRGAGDARVLVLSGLSTAFSAGVDIAEHAPEPEAIRRMLAAMRELLGALVEAPAVTLAAVSGACLGGGAEIVAACDLAICADDARIGFPEVRLACFPPGAVALLPLLVGAARAADWILSGRTLSGREAETAGFVSRSVAGARLAEEVDRLADRLAAHARGGLSAVRDLLRASRREALETRLPAAEEAYRGLAGDEDLARAVKEWGKRQSLTVIPTPSVARGRDPFEVTAPLRKGSLVAALLGMTDALIRSRHRVDRLRQRAVRGGEGRRHLPAGSRLPVRGRDLRGRAIRSGRPYRLAEHLDRMREGLDAIAIAATPDFFPAVAERLLSENGLADEDAFVYAQVSRGAGPRYHAFPPEGTEPTVFAFARKTDPPPPSEGSSAILLTDERWGRCDIKSVMLLPNVLSAQKAKQAGAIDAILVRDGFALEATKANLFSVSKGVLRTAPNGPRILPGVTRGAAIDAARKIGLAVEERAFTVEEMYASQEVFLASTTLWTQALISVEGRAIGNGKPGPVTRMIREALYEEFRARRRPRADNAPRSWRKCLRGRKRFP